MKYIDDFLNIKIEAEREGDDWKVWSDGGYGPRFADVRYYSVWSNDVEGSLNTAFSRYASAVYGVVSIDIKKIVK